MKSDKLLVRNLSQAIKAQGEKKAKGYFAMLGNLSGVVLTGTQDLIYVTTFEGQVRTVRNLRVPNISGDVVFVGTDEYSANRIEVLYSLNPRSSTNDGEYYEYGTVPPHSHSYDSVNPTWVQAAQFLPLLVLPYSGQTVQVFPGAFLETDGSIGWYAGEILDLSSYFPESGALWVIVQIDDGGLYDPSASIVAGTAAASRVALTYADIPAATTGKRICAIILEAGFNALYRSTVQNDFLDMRFFALEGGSGGGGGPGGMASVVSISSETLGSDGSFANVTIPAGYDEIWVRARVRTAGAGASDRVGLRVGTGASLDTGNNYAYTVQWQGASAGGSNSAAGSSISSPVTAGNGATASYFGDCEWVILSPGDTSQWKNVRATGGYVDDSGHRVGHGSGVWKNAGAIDILNILGISTATFKAGSKLQVLGVTYG